MTKVVKWWQVMSFWNKVKLACLSIGVASETGMFLADIGHEWKIIVGCLSVTGIIIGIVFEDKNSNGIADIFEDASPKKPKK